MYFTCELEITTTLVMTMGMVTWTVTYYLMNPFKSFFRTSGILGFLYYNNNKQPKLDSQGHLTLYVT